jgi:hypothetical protein
LDPLELFQKVLGASRKKTITVIQTWKNESTDESLSSFLCEEMTNCADLSDVHVCDFASVPNVFWHGKMTI